jgi:hypothetical protein
MFKRSWFLFLLFGVAVALLIFLAAQSANKQYDWAPFFTAEERQPHGCFILHDYMNDLFDGKVKTVRRTINDQFRRNEITSASNYIIINDVFNPTRDDVDQLCQFASEGGSVFISANAFGLLSDTLNIWVSDAPQNDLIINYNNSVEDIEKQKGDTLKGINFANPQLRAEKEYAFDREQHQYVFRRVDTANTTALGYDAFKNLNFIRIKYGQGEFLLHTIPNAFTNYYMSAPITADYAFKVISHLPVQQTWWDEHYKAGLRENRDSRRYMLAQPALRLSYLVLIAGGILLLLFGGKRRQRPVPVLPPVVNTTLAFVETIGALYYRESNHQDIIAKKINYFLTTIRERFYVQTQIFDEAFLSRIENLSGVPQHQVHTLFQFIDAQRNQPNISDQALRKLDQLIWDFNKQSKR